MVRSDGGGDSKNIAGRVDEIKSHADVVNHTWIRQALGAKLGGHVGCIYVQCAEAGEAGKVEKFHEEVRVFSCLAIGNVASMYFCSTSIFVDDCIHISKKNN